MILYISARASTFGGHEAYNVLDVKTARAYTFAP